MIGHFAWLYPDETVQSGIARSARRTEAPSNKSVVKSLFDRTTITAVTDLPAHLNTLARSIPVANDIDAGRLVDEHTLWPILTVFQPEERRARSRRDMMEHGLAYLDLGLMATRSPYPHSLRVCPICSARDRVRFGETYWHRVHQIPGVAICTHHSVRLMDSNVSYRHSRNRHDFRSADEAVTTESDVCEPVEGIEAEIAADASWVLLHPTFTIPASELRLHLVKALRVRGWTTFSGQIRMGTVKSAFREAYPHDVLSRLACVLPGYGETWLERMLRANDGCQHPVRYLLMLRFVGLRLPDLVNPEPVDRPFGRSPWPCLNKASNHFGGPTIRSCEVTVTRNGRSLLSTFRCSECGMVYQRIGPDQTLSDRLRRSHIPVYGHVWERRLVELWAVPDMSLRALAKILGVDPRTVCLQARRIGLSVGGTARRCTEDSLSRKTTPHGPRRDAAVARQDWLLLQKELPFAHMSQLRAARPDLYAFLQRHDLVWVCQNAPDRAKPKRVLRVDWVERDQLVAHEVNAAAIRLKLVTPPVRLTMTSLLREAGFIWVVGRKLMRMPMCRVVLAAQAESRRDYAIRRIRTILAECSGQSRTPSYWSLVRRAGLRPDLLCDKMIQELLHGQ